MDLSWQSMITQVLAVLYVAWLTASLRGTQQKMDKYVENYVSIIKAMKGSHYLFRFIYINGFFVADQVDRELRYGGHE